ncbi:flagellar FliL protein [Paracoccus isoporae]|uniref:Flagellar protein FliL n=1 Tax=Paracoccus isoporae TaxID=591205 RepID=A0A1G6Z6Z5_9RHOB|nr:flagellar basal body-associated FliL family protein [Paracoccus isoporae]SDD98301.1 flagellar FliL protein [Paracoccus isoporae]
MAETATPPRTRMTFGRMGLPVAALAGGLAAFTAGYRDMTDVPRVLSSLRGGGDADSVAYVEMPRITVPLGRDGGELVLRIVLETDASSTSAVAAQIPRLSDSFNSFLSGIAPAAFDRRGVLEIIRLELERRAAETAQDTPIDAVLITEFSIR